MPAASVVMLPCLSRACVDKPLEEVRVALTSDGALGLVVSLGPKPQ